MVLISLLESLFPVAVTGQQPSGPTGWTQITTITIKDFDNYKFNEGKTQRNELNHINTFKSWINNVFTYHQKELNFNWFVLNQNEVLYKLFEHRNNNNDSIETLRKDIN
jgi:hypothetical protein